MRLLRVPAAGLALLLVVLASQGTGTAGTPIVGQPVAAVGPFNDPFQYGAPASPQAWNVPAWDVAVHIRNNYQYGGIDAMNAGHGPTCGPPPGTHPISTDVEAVFVCNNHVMTAINAGGYGAIYLTPDHEIDFSAGTTTLVFTSSTDRTSLRDWQDLWITPFDESLELPLPDWLPDLQGPPRDSVHIQMGEFNNDTNFSGEVFRNFRSQGLNSSWWVTEHQFMQTSAKTRSRFELDISRTHIRFGMPDFNRWWIDTSIPDLGWSRGVVQLGHHSYTPDKAAGCGPPVGATNGCQPNTWHWGGLSMSSAVPFTMIKANQRRIWAGTTTRATFPRPAPANAVLRFDAVGTLQVSYDGGQSWQSPQLSPENKHVVGAFENYLTPIPAGTSSVLFRGQPSWAGPWFARDLSIWADAPPAAGPVPTTTSGPAAPGSSTPSAAPSVQPMQRGAGVNLEPSMRPWRYNGPNPDGLWDPASGAARVDPEMALAQRLGVSTVRLEFPWPLIEPQRGGFDWSRADLIVGSAAAHHVALQPILVFTPAWAGGSATSAPSPADFSAFVSAVVSRYSGRIRWWEMWNEPDGSHYWTASQAQYVSSVLVPGYQAAHAADPAARVLLGGPGSANVGWLDGVYSAGGGGSFDVMAFHDYSGSISQIASDARTVQGVLNAHGQGVKPIWLGEFGVQEQGVRDTRQQALLKGVLTGASPIAMAQWYNLRDDDSMTCCPPATVVQGFWGLVEHDGTTVKDGFATMQSLITSGSLGSAGPGPDSSTPPPRDAGGVAPSPGPTTSGSEGHAALPTPGPR